MVLSLCPVNILGRSATPTTGYLAAKAVFAALEKKLAAPLKASAVLLPNKVFNPEAIEPPLELILSNCSH